MWFYTIVFDEPFATQIQQFGDMPRVDDALDAVYWALGNNPHEFPMVKETSTKQIRLIKTQPYSWAGGEIPKLLIWFTIDEDEYQVNLLAVKMQDEGN
jgi:hypothetical protein